MNSFQNHLHSIDNEKIRKKLDEILQWINDEYPRLEPTIKWNQPMFTLNGTYIIGFSKARKHLNLAPEEPAITKFEDALRINGYKRTKMLIQIGENQPVDYDLLKDIINFIIEDKKNVKSFWR